MNNPRHPFRLRVLNPILDKNDDFVLNYDGTPKYEIKKLDKVVMLDNLPQTDDEGNFITEKVDEIRCGYRTETQSTKTEGDVAVGHIKVSCEMFITPIYYGDVLEITDYERTYKASCIRKVTNNFGVNLFINEIHN